MTIETQKTELLDLVNAKNDSDLILTDVEMAVGATTDGKTALRLTPAAGSKYYGEDDVNYSKLDLEKYFHGITLVLDLKADQLSAGAALKIIADLYGLDIVDADIKDPDADIGISWNFPVLESVQVNVTDESYKWSGHVQFKARYYWRAIERIITQRDLDGLTYLETADGSMTSLQLTSYPLQFQSAAVELNKLKAGDTVGQAVAAAVNNQYNTVYGTQFDADGAILGAAKVASAGTAAELGFTGKDGQNVVIVDPVQDAVNKFAGQVYIFFTNVSDDTRKAIADMFIIDNIASGKLSQENEYYSSFITNYASMFAQGGCFFGTIDFDGYMIPNGVEIDYNQDEELTDKLFTDLTLRGEIVNNQPVVTIAAKPDSTTFQGTIVITYPIIGNNTAMLYSDGSLEPAHLLELVKTQTGNTSLTEVKADAICNILMSCAAAIVPIAGAVMLTNTVDGVVVRADAVWDDETKYLTSPEGVTLFGEGTAVMAEVAAEWKANNNYAKATMYGSTDSGYDPYAINPVYAALTPFAANYVRDADEIRHGGYSYPVYPEGLFYGQAAALVDLINLGAETPNSFENFDYYVKKARASQGWLAAPFATVSSNQDTLNFSVGFGRYSNYWMPTNLGSTQATLLFKGMGGATLTLTKGIIPEDLTQFDINDVISKAGWLKAMHVAVALCDYGSDGIVKISDKVVVTDLGSTMRQFSVPEEDGQNIRRGYVVVEQRYGSERLDFRGISDMTTSADLLCNYVTSSRVDLSWRLAFAILAHPDSDENLRRMAICALAPMFMTKDVSDWTVAGNASVWMDVVGVLSSSEVEVTQGTVTNPVTNTSTETTNVKVTFPATQRIFGNSYIWFNFPTPTTGKHWYYDGAFSGSSVSGLDSLRLGTDIGRPEFSAIGAWGAQVLDIGQYIDRRAVTIDAEHNVAVTGAAVYPDVTWETDTASGWSGGVAVNVNIDMSTATADPKIHGLLAVTDTNVVNQTASWAYAMEHYIASVPASDETRTIRWVMENMVGRTGNVTQSNTSNAVSVTAQVSDVMGHTSSVTFNLNNINSNPREVVLDWNTVRAQVGDADPLIVFNPSQSGGRDGIHLLELIAGLGKNIPEVANMLLDSYAWDAREFSTRISQTVSAANDTKAGKTDDVLVTNSNGTRYQVTLRITNIKEA